MARFIPIPNIPPDQVNVNAPYALCNLCGRGKVIITDDGFWTCTICGSKYWNN